MLRLLAWLSSVATVVCFFVLGYLQLSSLEQKFPLGSEASGALLLSQTGWSQRDALDRLAEQGERHDLEILLITASTADPARGLELYSLGARQPVTSTPLAWVALGRHGSLHPAADVGTANLAGTYAFRGAPAAIAAFQEWATAQGIPNYWEQGGRRGALLTSAWSGGAGATAVAMVVVWLGLVLAWFGARAESRAVRLLAGVAGWRIHAQDLTGLARGSLPAGAVALVGLGAVSWWVAGASNAARLVALVGAYLVALAVVAGAASVAVSLLTAPSVGALARRQPPAARFEAISVVLKGLALILALAALPLLSLQVGDAVTQEQNQRLAVPARDYVSMRVGGADYGAVSASLPAFDGLLSAADRQGELAYADVKTGADLAWLPPDTDGLFVTNTRYLARFGITPGATDRLEPVPEAEAARLSQPIAYALWLRKPEASLQDNGFTMLRAKTPLVAPASSGFGFARLDRALVLVSEDITTSLSGKDLFPALTNRQIMFDSPDTAQRLAQTAGVTSFVLGYERVADAAVLATQFAQQTVIALAGGLTLLVLAVFLCAWLAAQVYAASHAQEIFALRSYGWSWPAILLVRLVIETMLVVAIVVAVAVGYISRGAPFSPIVLVAGAAFWALSMACHVHAGAATLERVSRRFV